MQSGGVINRGQNFFSLNRPSHFIEADSSPEKQCCKAGAERSQSLAEAGSGGGI
jgi:hypothetical protein